MKLNKINQLILASALGVSFSAVAIASPTIEFGGAVEASITQQDDGGDATSDTQFTVDTVEIGVNANINDTVSAEVVLLAEDFGAEDGGDFGVDTALIHMNTVAGIFSVGKTEFAVATGESNMLSGPDSDVSYAGNGISLSNEIGIFGFSVYMADPDNEDNQATFGFGDLIGITVGVSPVENISLHAGYASGDGVDTTSSVAALAEFAGFGLIAELTSIDGATEDDSNFEVSYGFNFGTIAAGIQQNAGVDSQLISFGTDIYEDTSLTFEYKSADGAEDSFQVQLAYSF